MKLSQWAKKQGIHYQTALKWFKLGKIKGAHQLDTGTILVDENGEKDEYKEIIKLLKEIRERLR